MPTTYAIPDGRTVMAATLYTGNGSSQSINNAVNGVSFQPDLVWVKSRSNGTDNHLYDAVRGVNKALFSNATDAETTTNALSAFNSNGFTVDWNASYGGTNTNAATYVGWNWKANGTAVTNTAGSITSQVSANTTAGFSVVTYTGTGANATVGHGLGVAPSLLIVKQRNTTRDWPVWHISIANTQYLSLNATDAVQTAATQWNSTTPTSTVFSIGTSGGVNQSAGTYVAYCFAAVAGYSAFGSYTGNGSTDGPFVYLGFRPRFVMFKKTNSTGSWAMFDSSRDSYNVASRDILADSSASEYNDASNNVDFLSNGFKLRSSTADNNNASGATYIYMAFAETVFKFANAR
jgi:hypothetical protein